MSRPLPARVYAELAADGFHSGAQLAHRLGVSRNAIWKAVVALRELGLDVHAVRNRGYRLPTPCEPLDPTAIRAALGEEGRRRVRRLEAEWSIESTNAALLARTDLPSGLADILLAEYQTAGRGRRGRAWLAPPGGAICLSLGWSFRELPRDLSALGLAVGVCALKALRRRIARSAPAQDRRGTLALKWPNDLTVDDRKLGGILIEMRAESEGPTYVVIGIGINLALGNRLVERVAAAGTSATDLAAAGADPRPRNAIISELIEELLRGLVLFQQDGLRPFAGDWKAADALLGRPITIHTGDATSRGVARGIDASGTLLVETPRGIERLISGDVSVRPEHDA